MRAMRPSLKLLTATLLALLALTAALWLWSGSNSSLATLLARLQPLLPAGQTLEAKGVQGTLRTGGHIDWLRWQHGELSIEAHDIHIAWTLAPLFNKQLRLSQLRLASLHIDDQRSSADTTPMTPPTDLRLPITLDLPFVLDKLSLTGTTTLQASELSGHYRYDGQSHTLEQGRGLVASGSYQLSGQLQANAPMALALQAQGEVQTRLPSSPQAITVAARAELSGALAGPDAMLQMQASLQPVADPAARSAAGSAMQAQLSAHIAPWQAQPVTQALAQWQALNLAALWPQAPQTELSGEASVTPSGAAWLGQLKLSNARPGPWDQQRLPLDSLQADVRYDLAQWALQAMRASGAGGSITGSGQFDAGIWQGQAQLHKLNPAAIDTRLAPGAMSGTLQASQSTQGIRFEAQLAAQPSQTAAPAPRPGPTSLHTLQLQSLRAQGLWAAPQLTLSALQIDALDAHLEGSLAYHLNSQAAQGKLALRLPGLQATLDGNMASQSGQGKLAIGLSDASLASQWLTRWPLVADALQGTLWRGTAQLDASWQGGWQQQGRSLQVDARLRAPELAWRTPTADQASPTGAGRLQQLQADLAGTLNALTLRTQGQAELGSRQVSWKAQADGGQQNATAWLAQVNQLSLSLQDSARPGPWSLQTRADSGQPVTLQWQSGAGANTLRVAAGSARITGPQPGQATLSWQDMRWSQPLPTALAPTTRKPTATAKAQTTTPTKALAQWHSQGQISQLPLAWLEALSGTQLADLGLRSDLILAGHWDAKQTDALHLSATLERSSGDLRLRTDDAGQTGLPAGMREARLALNLNAADLSASLRWDSDRAGRALMAFSTRLAQQDGNWALDQSMPIGGSLQIQLPQVDAWSVLAPPGWRMRGTMEADIILTGTLAAPQWDGNLRARDLAVRSVADGIDFGQGSFKARLHGQQIDIEEFSLQGAATAAGSGGQLNVSGSVFWLATDSEAEFLSRLSMALEVQAQALRLSSRADRRVIVSGKLSAQLKQARLSLRGDLAVDQALITLPDDSAPRLGDDVVVRRTPTAAAATAAPKAGTASGTKSAPLVTDLLVGLDLGRNFQVRGRGLETHLAGKLTLRAIDDERPNLTGTVRTVRGTYRAYGQRLDIEQGILRFVGAADNPMLDILAIRPKLSQRVGVQVKGSALSPVVRLYSEPELPEAEKLAWLVLGRSASGSGGEAALLQQAALALLGGSGQGPSTSLTQALGLDELSFAGSNGDDTTTGATITLGKRLSKDFYVAYESSLAGSMGVFTIFYDLSRHLTLRAQTGEKSAVDLIWTLRYD